MKRSKQSSEEAEDRLSELPDPLIYEIFWLLPMRDVVRTTILSKRWENLWTTTPYLNFDGNYKSKFVSRALILWKGFKILKFKFGPNYGDLKRSMFSNIDVWVRWCWENGIQEFCVEDWDSQDGDGHNLYYVPQNLYSCSSLKVLSVVGYNFQIHGNVNVQWNQLKSLTIGGFLIDQNLIDKVISGSPQLEVFYLILRNRDENLSIRSTTLKDLWIDRNFVGEPSPVSELRIWSPNLETLRLEGVPYAKYSLMDVLSLTHLTLYLYFGNDFAEEILGQIFPTIQHAEKLTLSDWCIKGLREMKKEYLLSPLSNFKFLAMNNSEVEYEEILDLLRIFPNLETLDLQSDYKPCEFENHAMCFLQVERNLPKSFLLQLRTVEITFNKCDSFISPFIGALLKHASKLQKMVIRVHGIKPPLRPWFWIQKLLRMPRSSSIAELIFAEAKY